VTAGRNAGSRVRSIAVVVAAVAFAARPIAAQDPARSSPHDRNLTWSFAVGAIASTPLVEDGNGVTVRAGIAPFLSAGLSRRMSERVVATADIGGASAPLRLRSSGHHWRAGTTRRYDIQAGVELAASRVVTVEASAVAARLTGPHDVIPFRTASGALWTWGGEAGAHVTVARRARVELLVAAGITRLAAQRAENPSLAGGWVGHLRLGVRHDLR
jgi:hypothetical protein